MAKGQKRARHPSEGKKDDELGGEVVVRAHLDQTGLTVGGKSRFLAATDRLLGGLVGIPAAHLEGIRERAEIKNSVRTAQLRAQSRVMIDLLEEMNEAGRIAAQRFILEEIRKQNNREAVWAEATESVRALPPPNVTETRNDPPELEEDWISIFASFAEKASSERLRQLWGRILAGEVRRPGSFALSTLRVISEMDAEIAAAFQEVVAFRIGQDSLLKPDELKNEVLLKWTFLEEVGLLQEVNGNLSVKHSGSPVGYTVIMTENFYLKIDLNEKNPSCSFPIVRITRVGQQIADILPWNEPESLRQLAQRIMEQSARLELGRVVNRYPGGFTPQVIEVIKPLEQAALVRTGEPGCSSPTNPR